MISDTPKILADGRELIARMATEALNLSHRERDVAKRLFEQWLVENADLREAVAARAISETASRAISRDIRIERTDVLRTAERLPIVENGVSVEAVVVPPRDACLPIPSREADQRRAARLTTLMGHLAFPLPVTNKLLGDAFPWEIKAALDYYWSHGRGQVKMAQRMALTLAALPDRNKPASRQRPCQESLDKNQVAKLWREADRLEQRRTLSLKRGAA
jgi:hypothetical protein